MKEPQTLAPVIEINRLHASVTKQAADSRSCLNAALEAAWQAGKLLIAEKKRVRQSMGPGAWILWLERYFKGTPRTAQRYMSLAQSEADISTLRGMSLRQVYNQLGIATEPKTQANRAEIKALPDHLRFTQKLLIALKPCAHFQTVTADQREAYRRDLKPLYDLLRLLFDHLTC